MVIYESDRSKLMEIEEFSRDGSALRFRGKIMGAMPVTAVVIPSQVRQMLKALGFALLLFAIPMIFRRDLGRSTK